MKLNKLSILILFLFISNKISAFSPPIFSARDTKEQKILIAQAIVETAGGEYKSFGQIRDSDWVFFNEPQFQTTLAVKDGEIELEFIQKKLEATRQLFREAEERLAKDKPEYMKEHQLEPHQVEKIMRNM